MFLNAAFLMFNSPVAGVDYEQQSVNLEFSWHCGFDDDMEPECSK